MFSLALGFQPFYRRDQRRWYWNMFGCRFWTWSGESIHYECSSCVKFGVRVQSVLICSHVYDILLVCLHPN